LQDNNLFTHVNFVNQNFPANKVYNSKNVVKANKTNCNHWPFKLELARAE